METIKEIYFSFKKSLVLNIILIILVFSSLSLLYTILIFSDQSKYELESLNNIYNDKAIYQLIDNYYEPGDFSNFRQEADSLQRLKSFYSQLTSTDRFDAISIFTQPLLVRSFKGNELFEEGYEDGMRQDEINMEGSIYLNIKSIQMNQKALDLFDFQIENGRPFYTSDFNKFENRIPVLLGNKYEGYYNVGDKFDGIYYGKNFEFEVIGILSRDQRLYYNYSPDFYVDNYVIIPYINFGIPQDKEDGEFQKILYFAMINSYVFVNNNSKDIELMMNTINDIASEENIEYTYMGLSESLVKYNYIINIVTYNINIIFMMFICSVVITMLIIHVFMKAKYNKQKNTYYVRFLSGEILGKQIKVILLENVLLFFISTVLTFLLVIGMLNLGEVKIIIYILFYTCLLFIISSLYSIKKVYSLYFCSK